MSAHDRPGPEPMRILARLSPAQELAVARRLRDDALALKEAWLRERHPGEDDAAIAGACAPGSSMAAPGWIELFVAPLEALGLPYW